MSSDSPLSTEYLESVLASLRISGEKKREYGLSLLPQLCKQYMTLPSSAESSDDKKRMHLYLRIIGNCLGDDDENRLLVLNNCPEFLKYIADPASHDKDDFMIVSPVLFNFANDYEPGLKFLCEHTKFGEYIYQQMSCRDTIAPMLIELCVNHSMDPFSSNSDPDDNRNAAKIFFENFGARDEESSAILLKLFELNNDRELLFASNRHLIDQLFEDLFVNTNVREIVGIAGLVSSHPEFSELVKIDPSDPLFNRLLNEGLVSRTAAAMSAIVLGNMAVSTAAIEQLIAIEPNLVPSLVSSALKMKSAYELQCVFFLKNVASANNLYAQQIVDYGGVALVEKLLDISVFPEMKRLGLLFAKALIATEPGFLCKRIVAFVEQEHIFEDECVQALSEGVICLGTDEEHLKSDVVTILLRLVRNISPNTLLKVTRSVGIVSKIDKRIMEVHTEQLNNILSDDELIKVKDNPELSDAIGKNLAFIAANVETIDATVRDKAIARVN